MDAENVPPPLWRGGRRDLLDSEASHEEKNAGQVCGLDGPAVRVGQRVVCIRS